MVVLLFSWFRKELRHVAFTLKSVEETAKPTLFNLRRGDVFENEIE